MAHRMEEGGGIRRWARALVALYPRSFREAYGDELLRTLIDRYADARRRGRRDAVAYVVRNTMICLRDAGAERVGSTSLSEMKRGGWGMGPTTMYTLRLAARGLLRRPGYSIPVLLTLVLGLGANTATFTVLNAVVLRPLPYPEAERIVEIAPYASGRETVAAFSLPDIRDWEARATSLEAFGSYQTVNSDLVLAGGAQAEELPTAYVTAGFFPALGTPPLLGRFPTAEEERTDPRVLVVSHGFWVRSLASDPAAVGRTLPLSGEEYTIVGVMPDGFAFPSDRIEVWALNTVIPAQSTPYHLRSVRLLGAIGRLADGVSVDAARRDLSAVARGLAADHPESNEGLDAARVVPLQDIVVGDTRTSLFVVMAAAGLILVIMWANLANLALARETRRGGEWAVRAALGASRARRAGLVLAESLILSVLAGVLGGIVAHLATGALVGVGADMLPRAAEIRPDWRVGAFTLAVASLTGLAVALLAGLRAGRADLVDRLRGSGRGAVRGRARGTLVASQVALSVVLLVGATLLARSLHSLNGVALGFEPEDLVVAEMTFARDRYPERADYLPRFTATLEALEAIPGVRSASSVRYFPFLGSGEALDWRLPGESDAVEARRGRLLQVGPRYFETMGIDFVEGSGFGPSDAASGRPVVIVGHSVARSAYPGLDAVGRFLLIDGDEMEIVGVVGDVRNEDLRSAPAGVVYRPNEHAPRRVAAFVVRGGAGSVGLVEAVRSAVRSADPGQPITMLATAPDIVGNQMARDRFLTLLLVLFAALALALSAVGVYGVVAFGVAGRRREMGIRLALGAAPVSVRRLVVRGGMLPVGVGVVLGATLAFLTSGVVERVTFGIDGFEPMAYVGSVLLLGTVALAACWLPARSVVDGRAVEALAEE